MAEGEDVIVDAAKHATAYLQRQWRRGRPGPAAPAALADHVQRLELLVAAAFGRPVKIRPAQPPAARTLLRRIFEKGTSVDRALPATDGESIWLPETLDTTDPEEALARYRIMALRQGMRAARGSAASPVWSEPRPVRDRYLVLEALAADASLAALFPGMARQLPPAPAPFAGWPAPADPAASLSEAKREAKAPARPGIVKDEWTGELREPPADAGRPVIASREEAAAPAGRSAKLGRTPKERKALEGEDERKDPGAFMVQSEQGHEHAEDPAGMQRPTDRDEDTAAEELAESVSDLPEARLVARPGSPGEVLLSSEAPKAKARAEPRALPSGIAYPEWDWRAGAYRTPGAIVRTPEAGLGDPAWAQATLERHGALVATIRRRFELLQAHRTRLRRRLDGEEIDLEACIEAAADFRAGLPRGERLYRTVRPLRREMAIMLLVDSSGSTDAWVSGNRRIVDVEREALLLVCIALEAMRERYAVQAFSGEGPGGVSVRTLKGFDEHHGADVSRRIAALEPDRYTRVGAALRHASAALMRESARHRLLLLLSDGKPNDVDEYDGRYGVEDFRQAVLEARTQGIFPFCLTVDRSAASYLPAVFGAGQYALLPRAELLPTALLDWLRRLASA